MGCRIELTIDGGVTVIPSEELRYWAQDLSRMNRYDPNRPGYYWPSTVKVKEFATDENGDVVGLKGLADHGHGYGFNNGMEEFSLKPGERYAFSYEYTSVEGPSDWEDDSTYIALKLVEENEAGG